MRSYKLICTCFFLILIQTCSLHQGSPGWGSLILVVTSTLFQLTLYCVKRFRDRVIQNRISNYMNELRSTLVENVVNVYGIIIILVVSFFSVVFVSNHLTTTKGNSSKAAGELTTILPSTIVLLLCVMAFAAGLPFFTRHALRYSGQLHVFTKQINTPVLAVKRSKGHLDIDVILFHFFPPGTDPFFL